jgi:hypothetical protein
VAKSDFCWVNAVDLATLTAGSEAAALPSSNLAGTRIGAVWRSLATTSWFLAKFSTGLQIDVLALVTGQYYDSSQRQWFASLAATDTVRHRLYASDGVTVLLDTGAIACGVLDGYRLHAYLLASPVTAYSWRCDIVAASRGGFGYFDIARAWAGPKWQPDIGIALPWDEAWMDGAVIMRGKLSGGLFPGDGPQYRTVNCTLDFMDDAEKAEAKEMSRICGLRNQVLVIPDEAGDVPREAILGHFDKLQPIAASQPIVPPVYQQSYSINQDL